MKKSVFSFLYIILFSVCTFAQTTWVWQNPKPFGTTISQIYFINSLTGWVTANLGFFYKTTNGGLSFEQYNLNTTSDFVSIYFVPNGNGEYTGWLSSSNKNIYKTTNSGNNWTIIYTASAPAYSLYFNDVNTGWMNAMNIYKTTNGGANWNLMKQCSSTSYGLYFINSTTGWNSEYFVQSPPNHYTEGYYYKTTNSGLNWGLIGSTLNYDNPLRDLYFRDSLNGFTFNDINFRGISNKTTNSGMNWIQNRDPSVTKFLNNTDIGYSVRNYILSRTTDFGNNWINIDTNLIFSAPTSIFINDYNNLRVGNKGGIILNSTNGGESWHNQLTDWATSYGIRDIGIPDTNNLIVIGDNNAFFRSTNSGNNWISLSPDLLSGSQGNVVFFLDTERGWVGCSDGKIFCTTNTGANWFASYSVSTTPIVYFEIFSSGTGYASSIYSYNGNPQSKLFKTTNSGLNWILLGQYYNYTIYFDFLNENIGYRTSEQVLAKTTDGGISWNTVNMNSSIGEGNFIYLSCLDTNYLSVILWKLYYNYETYKFFVSSNGGSNWTFSTETKSMHRNNKVCAFNSGNNIYISTNNGYNWVGSQIPIDNNIRTIKWKNRHLWIGCDYGNILKSMNTIPVGVDETSFSFINSYQLYQNFPNPFNPSTTINFQLPVAGLVSLKVYDMLGKVAATLVNEKLNAGTHSIDWNASQFPSGIYFYVIETNEFSESRKMVLLK